MSSNTDLTRRKLLVTTGSAITFASVGGLAKADMGEKAEAEKAAAAAKETDKSFPDYVAWKDQDSMILHSSNTIETKRSAFGQSGITPLNRLYVRNNVNPPSEEIVKNPDEWSVTIEGVGSPKTLTVAELKNIGVKSVAMVLQCAGNGRAWFPHEPSGTQWEVGAAGCVVFTGVPVKDLLEHLGGMEDGAKYMTSTGGEEIPEGLDPNTIIVERSVPAEASEEAILAWEVNGEPLPLAHGGPLRMVIPGYIGINNIKYVKKVAFTEEQSPANIQQNSYRWSDVGVKGSPEHESIWETPPKSWINTPSDPDTPVKAGKVLISGVTFGGTSKTKKIEVSVNGGKDWQEAKLVGIDLGKYAWQEFQLSVDLKPGEYELVSRATNESGDTQPEERRENNRGYLNNSWRDHGVKITVA